MWPGVLHDDELTIKSSTVRLPRQPGGSATIVKEARWLPLVGASLPVRVPAVVAVGEPGFGYSERWSVVRWIDGATPTVADQRRGGSYSRLGLARDLAEVVTALRAVEVPREALNDHRLSWYRGGALAGATDLPVLLDDDAPAVRQPPRRRPCRAHRHGRVTRVPGRA